MNLILFTTLLILLQLIYWNIGRKASKNLKDTTDYFLAGKKVKFFPLMMTLLATQVGGGLFLGATDEAYRFGWYVLAYPLGYALGLILLGLGIGKKLAQFQVTTVAQLLEETYRSPILKKIASIFSITSLFMILVAQLVVSQKFLMTLGLTNTGFFIGFWAIIFLYTSRGGMKAVISTDILQALFFSVIVIFCFCFAIYSGPAGSFEIPPLESFSLVTSKFTGWLLMPLLFMIIEQDIGQRCFAGSSPKVVTRASLWSGIFLFCISVIPIYFGIIAKNLELVIPQGSSVFMTVIETLTNPWVTALTGCSILAAIISTATSLINAISANISNDFTLTKKSSVSFIRGITGIISLVALIVALYLNNIVDLMIQSYELSVSCLFVPIFLALFKKRRYFISALSSIIFGAFGFFFFRIFPVNFPTEILSLLLSFGGYFAGEGIAKYRNKRKAFVSEV